MTSVPDSLRKEFKTKNGRIVLDGAGIEPDQLTEPISYAPISYSLVARNHVFDFATEYFYKHSGISSAGSFEITDEDYSEFLNWLKGKEYDYTTYLEKSVEDMRKNAEKVAYYPEIKEQIEALETRVKHSKEQDLITHQKEIRKILSEEIVSRYYFQEGMIAAGLREDIDIVTAQEFLNSPEKVRLTLTASGK